MSSPLKRFQRRGWLIGSLAFLMGLGWSNAVRAEGSVDLIRYGGYRPFLDFRADQLGGIPRQTIIRVYAQTGETINLASSAHGLGITGTISYTAPAPDPTTGNTVGTCVPPTAVNNFAGRIPNLAAEVAGSGVGYTPCTITVGAGQTGVWEIRFVSPALTNPLDPPPTRVDVNWTQPPNRSYVAAWDVTVRDGNGQAIPGRTYANYLALNLGGNGSDIAIRSRPFILTRDGYLYQIQLNTDPFGFIFFANDEGFKDPATGASLFESINTSTIGNLITAGYLDNPAIDQEPPAGGGVTHKIFLNPPSSSLPPDAPASVPDNSGTIGSSTGRVWLRRPAEPIPIANNFNFRFVGRDGTPNQAGPTLGGDFVFDASGQGNYLITIDINRNGVVGDGEDVILRGLANAGINSVPWDGRDRNGAPVPAGTTPYNAVLTFFVGDVHFPFIDPENNLAGLTIARLNPTSLAPENTRIYYNDSTLPPQGGPTDPISALAGVDSSGGAHRFGNGTQLGFGNNNGIDTWTSLVEPLTLTGGILIQKADLSIVKTDSPDPVSAGESITYTIAVTNNQPPPNDIYSNVRGARVTDTVPSDITAVSWTCAITVGTGACGTASGTGNNIDLTVDLDVGATATITVNGTVSPLALGPLNNTATVERPPDVTDPNPDNNTDPEDTPIAPNPVQPGGIKSVRLFADGDGSGSLTTGDIVEYTIRYANNSSQNITGFQATDTIDTSQLTYVSGSYSFAASGAGTTVTANPNYNGTTDPNINTSGALGAQGGQIVVKFRAVVIAPAGSEIRNQGIARTENGTVNPSITDAFAGPEEIVQIVNDGTEQGNFPNLGDDEPTVIQVVGPEAGPARLRLVKRITNVTRNGVPISGINFGSFVDDPNTDDDNAAGWAQLPGGAPVGLFNLGSEASLQSGDEVEYSVYFLSDGPQNARTIRLCDPIPTGTAFSTSSISLTLPSAGLSNQAQTDATGDDRGSFVPALNVSPPFSAPPCPNPNNPTGGVFVELGDIPNTAPSNVGFVRFRVRID